VEEVIFGNVKRIKRDKPKIRELKEIRITLYITYVTDSVTTYFGKHIRGKIECPLANILHFLNA